MEKIEFVDWMIEWIPLIFGVGSGCVYLILGSNSNIPFFVVIIGSIIMCIVVTVGMSIIRWWYNHTLNKWGIRYKNE